RLIAKVMPLSSVTATSELVVAGDGALTANLAATANLRVTLLFVVDEVFCFALSVVFVSVGALSPVLVGAATVGSVVHFVFSFTVSVAFVVDFTLSLLVVSVAETD